MCAGVRAMCIRSVPTPPFTMHVLTDDGRCSQLMAVGDVTTPCLSAFWAANSSAFANYESGDCPSYFTITTSKGASHVVRVAGPCVNSFANQLLLHSVL